MAEYEDLCEVFRNLETQEILDRLARGDLTDLAKGVAKEELFRRQGFESDTTRDVGLTEVRGSEPKKSIFDGIWWKLLVLMLVLKAGTSLFKGDFQTRTVTNSTSSSAPFNSGLPIIRPRLPQPDGNPTFDSQAFRGDSGLSKLNESSNKASKTPKRLTNTDSFRSGDDRYNYLVPQNTEGSSPSPLPSGTGAQPIEWSEKEVGRIESK